jgi:hypothetical protein
MTSRPLCDERQRPGAAEFWAINQKPSICSHRVIDLDQMADVVED